MSAPDDVIWTEIWEDGIRFNSISTYCDDGNIVYADGFRRHPCYCNNKIDNLKSNNKVIS